MSGRRGRVFAVGSRVLGRSYAVQVRLSAIGLPAPSAHPYSRTQIIGLLELLPRLYQETQYGEVALGAAVKGALAGLVSLRHSASRLSLTLMFQSGCGGQLCIFLSSLPNWGPGALKSREDPLLYGTDKEKSLYSPAIPFWRNTAEELAEAGVGVNTFLFPERYIDAASVGKSLLDPSSGIY